MTEPSTDEQVVSALIGMGFHRDDARWAARVEAAESDLASLRGVVQAAEKEARRIVDHATRLGSPDGYNDTWQAGRKVAAERILTALAAAADAPQPNSKPAPSNSRILELTRLGVLHPDRADQPGPSPAVLPEKEQQR